MTPPARRSLFGYCPFFNFFLTSMEDSLSF